MRSAASPSLLLVASMFVVAAAGEWGCRDKPPPKGPTDEERAVAELAVVEKSMRASTDFATQPSSDRLLGADPYVIARWPARKTGAASRTAPAFAGLLRNADRVVALDASLHEMGRAETGKLASALAVTPSGDVLVAGASGGEARAYRFADQKLEPVGSVDLGAGDVSRRIRSLAVHESGAVLAVDEANDALVVAPADGGSPIVRHVAAGPIRVVVTPGFVVIASLIGHAITVFRLDPAGRPDGEPSVVTHDGPIWSIAAQQRGSELIVAAGGVEDHPLDRTGGSFAYVDSYLYLYRFGNHGASERLKAIDVGERGVITPKAIAFAEGGASLWVTGYGAPRALVVAFPRSNAAVDYAAAPSMSDFYLPPGSASITLVDDDTVAIANPLFDAWVLGSRTRSDLVAVTSDLRALPRSDASRLGEALFFTNLMSPWAKSDGKLSRFTCETCHFEGAVDGRTHATGRGDVSATTKPLLGLFNDAPHFTRALDRETSGMVDAEFRVAGQNSGHSPWFSLDEALSDPSAFGGVPAQDPTRTWPFSLPIDRARIDGSPKGLRAALMQFLFDFTPRPNPAVLGRDHFTPEEADGAHVFEERCADCHAPRLVADDPRALVPFEDWEPLIFGAGPDRVSGSIVWARDGYEKTGVEPYVHPDGARPSSLRRLATKRPYFTNGSAPSLDAVLDRARFSNDRFWHDASRVDPKTSLTSLDDDERAELRAFLELL